MPTLTIQEFNPSSGSLLGNISVLSYGKITSGTHSRVLCISIAFSDVTNIGSLKIGIISSAGLIVNNSPTDIAPDGTSSSGYFGIESSATWDSTKTASPLTRHFCGLNTSISASDPNNVSIPMRTQTLSNYIYLDINPSSSMSGNSTGSYKVWFDYN